LPQLACNGRVIEYSIKYSKLASVLKIAVDAKDGVQVTAPLTYHASLISSIMQDKSSWVIEKLDYLSALAGCTVPSLFVDGEQFFYLGQRCKIKVHINEQAMHAVKIVDQHMLVQISPLMQRDGRSDAVRNTMVEWYKNQAKVLINERINLHVANIGAELAKIRIKEQKHRWGSCSGKGNLNFNWHLVMAPVDIVDYVIVHELCHLKRLDHSPVFWHLVEAVLPDYQMRRHWLKQYGPVLTF